MPPVAMSSLAPSEVLADQHFTSDGSTHDIITDSEIFN